jgi:hypothetical protein
MDFVLRGLTFDGCLAHLNANIVIGRTLQEQLKQSAEYVPKAFKGQPELEPSDVSAVPDGGMILVPHRIFVESNYEHR